MILFPAIDLYEGKAVRLTHGDYRQMTVYHDHPEVKAKEIEAAGASWIHLVDLEGARDGSMANYDTIMKIRNNVGLKLELGGGIRSLDTVEKYLDAGIDRCILGTAAVKDPEFLKEAVKRYGEKIAVGLDMKDGYPAIKGWTEVVKISGVEFLKEMKEMGVKTFIITDISKDGAMQGTNRELYRQLSVIPDIEITASGGISSYEDLKELSAIGVYGAILGRAMYTGAVQLEKALEITGERV